MRVDKNSVSLVEDATLIMLGEQSIESSTVRKMFNRCVSPIVTTKPNYTKAAVAAPMQKSTKPS